MTLHYYQNPCAVSQMLGEGLVKRGHIDIDRAIEEILCVVLIVVKCH